MMRNTVAKLFRRWRSQYHEFSSASPIGVHRTIHPTQEMGKIALNVMGFCFKGVLCGTVGYVLGGLTSESLSESDLQAEQDIIEMDHYLDKHQRRVELSEKRSLQSQIRRSKSSI